MTDHKANLSQRPLAQLLAYIEGPARQQGEPDSPAGSEPGQERGNLLRKSYPELPLLDEFKATWIKLSANRQLERAQEQVPENAGPLHSSRLVTQALAVMQQISPAYLHTFMAYVDALSWTEQLLVDRSGSQDGARSAGAKGSAKPATREAVKPATKPARRKAKKDEAS